MQQRRIDYDKMPYYEVQIDPFNDSTIEFRPLFVASKVWRLATDNATIVWKIGTISVKSTELYPDDIEQWQAGFAAIVEAAKQLDAEFPPGTLVLTA